MNGSCWCGREWMSHAEAHCSICCSHFTSDSAFDRHLAAPNSRDICYDPATLRDRHGKRVFKLVQRMSGPTWTTRDDRPHPFAKTPVEQQGASDGSLTEQTSLEGANA